MLDFLFNLPSKHIAKYPLSVRSHSNLMVIDPFVNSISHDRFDNLINHLTPNDLLVFNDSKVIPARLLLHKATGGKVELFIERILENNKALVLLKSSKGLSIGSSFLLAENAAISFVLEGKHGGFFVVRLVAGVDWHALLNEYGQVPLPPYIRRAAEPLDSYRYQTVYAREPGSVAAPTAGLHFDDLVFSLLADKGISCSWLSLHVGYGTFAPLRSADVKHLHKERFSIDQQCCDAIIRTRINGGRVIAVGTTTCRVLESLALRASMGPCASETSLFIKPGFVFRYVDALITNFHLPGSSLLYLVAAFAGSKFIMNAYEQAIASDYRFYSYGDAMFIVRAQNQ